MIRVILQSETATSRRPARILVYDGEKLLKTIVAEIKQEKGADGGFYNTVKLREDNGQ